MSIEQLNLDNSGYFKTFGFEEMVDLAEQPINLFADHSSYELQFVSFDSYAKYYGFSDLSQLHYLTLYLG